MSDDAKMSAETLARAQAERWRQSPYYDQAEPIMGRHWEGVIWPIIKDSDFTSVVEIAAGHGRNSEYLLPISGTLHLTDINIENIEYCRKRFSGRDENISYSVGDGTKLGDVKGKSVTFVYSYDSMVHFHSDVVRSYLRDIKRALVPGGRTFLHHSNTTSSPGGLDVNRMVQGRNFMSREMFVHYAILEGLNVLHSRTLDWGGVKDLDGLAYLESQLR